LRKVSRQVGHVYLEIAQIYIKKERLDDAEKFINEGIAKLKGNDPELASKMLLFLGNIYQEKGKMKPPKKLSAGLSS